MNRSEVAKIMHRIEEEYAAMQNGMYGLVAGVARHDLIRARLDRVGQSQQELAQQVGEEIATRLVCELYVKAVGE
jgi:hypothetical protein